MSEKDGKSKIFMDANDRFADAFNYHMYGGEQVIKRFYSFDFIGCMYVCVLPVDGNTQK